MPREFARLARLWGTRHEGNFSHRRLVLLAGLACAAAAVFAGQVRGGAAEEVARLAGLLVWKAGTGGGEGARPGGVLFQGSLHACGLCKTGRGGPTRGPRKTPER